MPTYKVEFFNVYEWGIQTTSVEAENEEIAEEIAQDMQLGQLVSVGEEEE